MYSPNHYFIIQSSREKKNILPQEMPTGSDSDAESDTEPAAKSSAAKSTRRNKMDPKANDPQDAREVTWQETHLLCSFVLPSQHAFSNGHIILMEPTAVVGFVVTACHFQRGYSEKEAPSFKAF